MTRYVDGFVLPIPQANLAAYKKMARLASKVWKDHGCLQYLESVEDDVKPGKWTSFPQSGKLKKGEVVVFAFAIFKSRKARDAANKKIMADPRMQPGPDLPFSGARVIYGGFSTLLDTNQK